MSQQFKTATKFAGLASYPNALSDVQPGALQIADNVVVDKPGTVSPRRGQRVYATGGGAMGDEVPSRLFQVGDDLYGGFSGNGHPDAEVVIQKVVAGDTQPVSTEGLGSLTPPPGNAVHSAEIRNCAFLTSSNGIAKLVPDSGGVTSGVLAPAGVAYGLDIHPSLSAPATGTQGFLAGGYATAYRVVFGATDGQGNTVLGAPSPSVQVENPTLDGLKIVPSGTLGTVNTFQVNTGFVSPASAAGVQAYIVQGSQIHAAQLTFTNGSALVTVRCNFQQDSAYYFGPVGTAISIAIPITIDSVTTSTTLNISSLISTRILAVGGVVYSPYNAAAPASTTAAALQSSIVSTAAGTVTVAAGTWAAGSAAYVGGATISTAQANVLQVSGASAITPQVNDVLVLPGAVNTPTVLAYAPPLLTLDAFPTGMVFTSGSNTTITDVTTNRPKNVTVLATVPVGIRNLAGLTGYSCFAQLYRSGTQAPILDAGITAATDNMQLAFQLAVTVSDTQLTIVDIAPDATLGTDLYTAPRQGGATSAKYPPPVASDMCLYNDTLLFGDCYLPAALDSQLLGVSATANAALRALQPGDVFELELNGSFFILTAIAVGVPTADQFLIVTGTGSVTNDIYQTVLNLSQAFNKKFYGPTVPPATPSDEALTLLSTSALGSMGGNFRIQVSGGVGTFNITYGPANGQPSPFTTPLDGTEILPTRQQNLLYYSQPSEPEAVPLVNYIPVGQANTQIQRIAAIPGACLVFKPEGIYQLTGTDAANFQINLLNTTAQLLANETVVSLQSSVMAFTNQGVITVSQGGVQITSIAINQTLLDLVGLPAFASTAFAVAHEAERRYILWTPTASDDTLPTQAYAYNVLTNAWTRWPIARLCGIANRADQLLYTGTASLATGVGGRGIYQETAPGTTYPYGDEAVVGTIAPLTATTISFTPTGLGDIPSIAANFPAGSALVVPVATTSVLAGVVIVTSVTDSGSFLTLGVSATWDFSSTTGCTLYQGTECTFAPVPVFPDDPGTVKQFQEFELEFENTDCSAMTVSCATDFGYDETVLSLSLIGAAVGTGYGSGTWGSFPWGSTNPRAPVFNRNARQLVPRGASRGHYWWPTVSATVACNAFHAQGLTLAWAPTRSLRSR